MKDVAYTVAHTCIRPSISLEVGKNDQSSTLFLVGLVYTCYDYHSNHFYCFPMYTESFLSNVWCDFNTKQLLRPVFNDQVSMRIDQ